MPITYIQPGQAGVSNNTPSWLYIETNDTYATVTTTGYLSGAANEYINSFKNNMMALISTKTSQSIGVAPVLYVLQLQNSNGVWSLVDPGNDVPVPFIVEGNIQAGSSGVAGALISYPATGSRGALVLAAASNTGNTVTEITNDAMAQASVINIPDPGNAIGQFMIGATANPFVSGNLPKASGTAGLFVDSGIPAVNYQPLTAIVTMTAAQVNGAYALPFQIVAAPASGFALMPIACQIITVVSTAFTAGGIAQLQWGNTNHAGGTVALEATTPNAEITAAASQIYTQYGVATTTATAIANANGLGLYFTNATQPFATGTGSTVTIAVTYMTVPV